jgi:hypothetical protein
MERAARWRGREEAVLTVAGHAIERITEGTKALCPRDVKAATVTDAIEAANPPQMSSRLRHIDPHLPSGGAEAVPASPRRHRYSTSREGTSLVQEVDKGRRVELGRARTRDVVAPEHIVGAPPLDARRGRGRGRRRRQHR